MKQLLVLLIFIPFTASGQKTKNENNRDSDFGQMKIEINDLRKQVKELQLNSQEIKRFKESKEETDKEKAYTITLQNAWIVNFGVVFTVMAIVITVFGIVIPLLISYIFAIRPSEKAIKELQNDLDKKVTNYLEIERIKKIDQYANDLNGNDLDLKVAALNFFKANKNEKFSDNHLMQFHTYLRSNAQDEQLFANLLTSRKNIYADMLFQDKTQITKGYFQNIGLLYISQQNKSMFKESIKEYLKICTNIVWYNATVNRLKSYDLYDNEFRPTKAELLELIKRSLGTDIFGLALTVTVNFIESNPIITIKELLNDASIIDVVPNNTLYQHKPLPEHLIELIINKGRMNLEDFNETYLGKKIANSTSPTG